MNPTRSSREPIDSKPPLGAHWDGERTDFRVFSARAERVELCLFETPGSAPERRLPMARKGNDWHLQLTDVGPGTLYGYRAHGPFRPQDGLLFNPGKLLIDPYAKAVTGEPTVDPALFGFRPGENPRHSYESRDSSAAMPKCVVVDDGFDWQGVEKPRVPWRETVIYEAHVQGLTRLHPEVPDPLRGTYLGLAQPPVIEHLLRLGVTAVELLPVFQSAPEAHLLAQGRRNYWGYSPVSFFAPHAHYACRADGGQVEEWKTMVRELHRAGLEVILDVVYNHTAEGGLSGPIYGLKGFGSPSYYRLRRGLPSRWIDLTGCGNTLDIGRPAVLRLVLDSLRYWVRALAVHGFRFDLATVLGRRHGSFDPESHFFQAVRRDAVLAGVKWIAEPWDLGNHGYRLGGFPAEWSEWNDRFRDTARRFWRGEAHGHLTGELAARLSGSRDLFEAKGRGPHASINYVISHDGFTLQDWVSYESKHNEANGEQNRDGTDNNLSRNWGCEGPTDDPAIQAMRDRTKRNVMATLLLAQGVPMLQHGDEIGRTQRGNNNPYCQDNEIAWTDWHAMDRDFFDTVAGLVQLRRRYPHFQRDRYGSTPEAEARDGSWVEWLGVEGSPIGEEDWGDVGLRSLIQVLHPSASDPVDVRVTLLIAWHGGQEPTKLCLPKELAAGPWCAIFDSSMARLPSPEEAVVGSLAGHVLPALSVTVFCGRRR